VFSLPEVLQFLDVLHNLTVGRTRPRGHKFSEDFNKLDLKRGGVPLTVRLFGILTLVLPALFIYFISQPKVTYGLSFKVICDLRL
jgi:hypothetical protein